MRNNIAKSVTRNVIFKTPVDTGLARGSWRITQRAPSRATPRRDPGGAATFSRAIGAIKKAKLQNDLFLTNTAGHTALINTGIIRITKAQPFAAPGYVEEAVRQGVAEAKGKNALVMVSIYQGGGVRRTAIPIK
jgi:hypothetical protein